jgi:hypothetical protein
MWISCAAQLISPCTIPDLGHLAHVSCAILRLILIDDLHLRSDPRTTQVLGQTPVLLKQPLVAQDAAQPYPPPRHVNSDDRYIRRDHPVQLGVHRLSVRSRREREGAQRDL